MDFTSIATRYGYSDSLISKNSDKASKSIASLSSGKRIVRAGDDVASLSVASKLTSHVITLRSNLNNLAQANSLLQVMDDSLSKTNDILQRMQSIVTMANSSTISKTERGFLQIEIDNLTKEIDRLLKESNFSGVSLFGNGYHTPATAAPTADIASLYDVQSLETGTYTVKAGSTVFTTHVETVGEGDSAEHWLLIGRGRDGWEFDEDGQGDLAYLSLGLGTPGAFDPVAVDSASINALLTQNGLSLDDIEIRIKRAADEGGQSYQELRQRPLGPQQWMWQLDDVNYDTDYEVKSSTLGAGFTDSLSSISDTLATQGIDSGDDYTRMLTASNALIDINGGVQGFQYGAAVAGTSGTSNPNSFFWDSGLPGHAMPYAEVYIRVKDTVTHNPTAVADEFVDPRSIKGLELWLDASDIDGDGTSEGLSEAGQTLGAVQVWRDKSGNNADMVTTSATGPTTGTRTINGLNALDFNGAQAMVNTLNAADLYGDDYTWYVVAQDDAQVDDDFLLYAKAGPAGLVPGGVYDGMGDPTLQLESHLGFGDATSAAVFFQMNGGTGNESRLTAAPALRDTVQMMGAEWKIGEYATSYVNGLSSSKFSFSQVHRINGSQTATTFAIGSNGSTNTTTSRWHDGAIAEIIVVSNRMSVDERQRLEGYLAQKWGITDDLPDYHLYKSESASKALQMKISDAYANNNVLGNVNVNGYENVTYSLNAYKDIFAVDSQTGEITVKDTFKLLALNQESIRIQVTISGEGVGSSPLYLPVEIALDKRYLSFDVLDGEDRKLLVSVDHFNTTTLFDNQKVSVLSQEDAIASSALVLEAIDKTTSFRAEVGAKQSSVNILTDYNVQALRNHDAARATIEDTDVAAASTEFAISQVKTNVSVAIAAQANQLRKEVANSIFDSLGS